MQKNNDLKIAAEHTPAAKIFAVFILIAVLFTCGCGEKSAFAGFIVFDDTNSIYRQSPTPDSVLHAGISVRVLVTGIDEKSYDYGIPYSIIYIRIVDDYGKCGIVGKDYKIMFVGSAETEMYRQPMPIVGWEYIILNIRENNPEERTIEASFWFELRDYNGEEFMYPYYIDCSGLECKLPLDEAETKEIYRSGLHREELRYMKLHRIANPEFECKLRISDFLSEYRGISLCQ